MKRRSFLLGSMAALSFPFLNGLSFKVGLAKTPLKILVLGGTNFVGPAIVNYAVSRGHEVTLFNRGITRPHLFPELEKLRGYRSLEDSNLAALEGTRKWDAVIDVWPEQSRLVEETAHLLRNRTDYYYFVSSIAVYKDFSKPGLNEKAPIWVNEPGWYGGEKANAEQILQDVFEERFGVSRNHAIIGPLDSGSAYFYWLQRFSRFDRILGPGNGNDPVQFVDVRDVGYWAVDCAEHKRVGIYNLCGPQTPLTLKQFLQESRDAIDSKSEIVWVDADFLRRDQGVGSFSDMPFWLPLDEDAGFCQIDTSKSLRDGMQYRPVGKSAWPAHRWYQSYFFKDVSFPYKGFGISRERELEILNVWDQL